MNKFKKFLSKLISGGGILFDLSKWIILTVVVLLLITRFLITIFIVDGESMEPNLHDKEAVLLQVNSYSNSEPVRGDVVVVRYPGDPENKKYVKRVIGLPGETIQIMNGGVYIGGKPLDEKYLKYDVKSEPSRADLNIWVLSSQEYFLMGDNRPFSNDSRYFGPVEKRFFDGRAISIVFPQIRSIKK